MLKNIKRRIANYYAEKAHEEIIKGDFEAIMRSLKYLKKSISIVPPSKELVAFGKKMRELAEAQELTRKEEMSH